MTLERIYSILQRYGPVLDLRKNPDILQELARELCAADQPERSAFPGSGGGSRPAFGVSWMDSWVAHWVFADDIRSAESRGEELAQALRSLVDLKFDERLRDIRSVVERVRNGLAAEPPDGGSPEPGVPPDPSPTPAGPEQIWGEGGLVTTPFAAEPPDGGPPEPGVPPDPSPPEPPDGGPPEPGVPPGPTPSGPEAGFLGENPWILLWFVSLKAPQILDVIDVQLSRRLDALMGR